MVVGFTLEHLGQAWPTVHKHGEQIDSIPTRFLVIVYVAFKMQVFGQPHRETVALHMSPLMAGVTLEPVTTSVFSTHKCIIFHSHLYLQVGWLG